MDRCVSAVSRAGRDVDAGLRSEAVRNQSGGNAGLIARSAATHGRITTSGARNPARPALWLLGGTPPAAIIRRRRVVVNYHISCVYLRPSDIASYDYLVDEAA